MYNNKQYPFLNISNNHKIENLCLKWITLETGCLSPCFPEIPLEMTRGEIDNENHTHTHTHYI